MAERTCDVDGCERAHLARGMCSSHYGTWHRRLNGRTNNHKYFDITCEQCGEPAKSSRPTGRFCSDACKGKHYSATMQRRCKLPADHPVMVLIAEARRPKPKPVKPDPRTPRECPGCGCHFSPLHRSSGHMVCCSEPCVRRVQRRRRRAREHGARGSWTWSEFMRIARKFDYCCAYCGTKPERLDPDHVVPLSRGGSDSPSNLLPTCSMCNSSKCAMSLIEWSEWLVARGLPARVTSWTPGDPRYIHLTDALLAQAA